MFFKAAVEQVSVSVAFDKRIVDRHGELVRAFKYCCKVPKSKWTVLASDAPRRPTTIIFSSEDDVSTWLHAIKKLRNVKGGAIRTD